MARQRKRQHHLLAQSTAYRRLAAKAFKAGNMRQWEHYTNVADRRYREYQRAMEARAARRAQHTNDQGGTA